MRRGQRELCLAALVVASLLAGCTTSPARMPSATMTTKPSTTLPPPAVPSLGDRVIAPSATAASSLLLTPYSGRTPWVSLTEQHYEMGTTDIARVHTWSHYVVFSRVEGQPQIQTRRVDLLDLDTGRIRTIARSRWPAGVTDWAVGTGHFVAWTDEHSVPDDAHPAVAWELHLTDIETGTDRILASSHNVPEVYVPLPHAEDGLIVWMQFHTPGGWSSIQPAAWQVGVANGPALDVHVYDTATGVDRIVASGPQMADATITHRCVIVTEASQENVLAFRSADLVEIPVDGGAPVVAAHLDGSQSWGARNGWVSWLEPGINDPTSVWVMPVPTGCGKATPIEIDNGPANGYMLVTGPGFAAYQGATSDGDVLYVRAFDEHGARSLRQIAVPASPVYLDSAARVDIDGNRIVCGVWTRIEPSIDAQLVVVTVTITS
ncbi:MAG: hypothetical protein K6T37_05625 [Acidothermus cellulolyticus]|nr:hypothetical protein [Acidothermus cellulolyticus]